MSKLTKIILAALFALLTAPALAQDKPDPLAEYWVFTPNSGESADFWKAFKEHIDVRSKAGDPWAWRTYTPLLGDNMGRVSVRYCCFKWADVDAYRAWNEENPNGSVQVPNTGTQIRVKSISTLGSFMQVQVRPAK